MKKRIAPMRKVSLAVFGSYLMLTGMAHIPEPKPVPSKKFVKDTYVRYTGEHRWYASEKRRRQILAEIRKIREAIRLQAQVYYASNKRQLAAIAETESFEEYMALKIAAVEKQNDINCTKLLMSIRAKIREQHERNTDQKWKITVDFNTIG